MYVYHSALLNVNINKNIYITNKFIYVLGIFIAIILIMYFVGNLLGILSLFVQGVIPTYYMYHFCFPSPFP